MNVGQKSAENSESREEVKFSEGAKSIAEEFGVTLEEAHCLDILGETNKVKDGFWKALCQMNEIQPNLFDVSFDLSDDEQEANKQLVLEEVEVLKAIFPEEKDLRMTKFVDSNNATVTQLLIPIKSDMDENQIMCVHYHEGSYPRKHPKVFIIGGWNSGNPNGAFLHSNLIRFISELPNDEPMVFEVFNYVQDLLLNLDDMKGSQNSSLLPYLGGGEKFIKKPPVKTPSAPREEKRSNEKNIQKMQNRRSGPKARPRTKSFFWSHHPKDTPPAKAFPKLRTIIENARKRLPAAKARDEFLRVMAEADNCDRVLLVTGETGKSPYMCFPLFSSES